MNERSCKNFPRELLAAYADGELDPVGREQVERWLEDHPQAREEIIAQRELSPSNTPLWDAVEPPEVSFADWATLRGRIQAQLNRTQPVRTGRSKWAAGGLLSTFTVAGVAASMILVAVALVDRTGAGVNPARDVAKIPVAEVSSVPAASMPRGTDEQIEIAPQPRIPREELDPLAGLAVLPMANDEDVILERVPALRGGWLPSGQHPIRGMLELASVDEVHLEDVSPSPAWPAQGPKMTVAPGDSPMIFAAKPR